MYKKTTSVDPAAYLRNSFKFVFMGLVGWTNKRVIHN